MYVGTQIEPRDDSDYRVWAQLGVTHVCVDPPGSPHYWSLDALRRHKDHVESFGLSLDMVQLPISSGPIEAGDKPHILLAKGNAVHFTIWMAVVKSIRTIGCDARGRSG